MVLFDLDLSNRHEDSGGGKELRVRLTLGALRLALTCQRLTEWRASRADEGTIPGANCAILVDKEPPTHGIDFGRSPAFPYPTVDVVGEFRTRAQKSAASHPQL